MGKKTKEGQKTELGRQKRLPSRSEGFGYLVKMPEQLTGLALSEPALVHCACVVCNTQICTGTGTVYHRSHSIRIQTFC
jgi:hypothetical protein